MYKITAFYTYNIWLYIRKDVHWQNKENLNVYILIKRTLDCAKIIVFVNVAVILIVCVIVNKFIMFIKFAFSFTFVNQIIISFICAGRTKLDRRKKIEIR